MFSMARPEGAYSWKGFSNGIKVARQQPVAWTDEDPNGFPEEAWSVLSRSLTADVGLWSPDRPAAV